MTSDFSGNQNLDENEMRLPSNEACKLINCGIRTLDDRDPQSSMHSLASGTIIATENNKWFSTLTTKLLSRRLNIFTLIVCDGKNSG